MDVFSWVDSKFLLLFTIVLLGAYIYLSWPYNYFKNLGVPGPPAIPLWTVFRSLDKGITTIDEDMITKYGKVFGFIEGWWTMLMVADPELIKEVGVKLSSKFVDRREITMKGPMKHSVVDQRGDNWRRLRSLSTPFFTTGKLKRILQTLSRKADFNVINSKRVSAVLGQVMEYLEDTISHKTAIEAKEFGSHFTMDVICNVVFGIDTNTLTKAEHPLTESAKKLVADFGPKNPWFVFIFVFPALARCLDWFGVSMYHKQPLDYIANVCQSLIQQKEQGNQDAEIFVTALLKAHEEELDFESKKALGVTENVKHKGMTEEEILAQAMIFVFAGYDTTSSTLGFLLHALTMDPGVQQTLYEEIDSHLGDESVTYDNVQDLEYLNWCIDETLRLYPPSPRTDRECNEDGVTVAGIPLKKGHNVLFPIWYLHHQPDVWPDPYKFDPLRFSPEVKQDRHPYYFIPFGVGPRNCIGMRLALLQIKMLVVTVLQKYKLVPNGNTVPVELDLKELFTTAKDGLWFSVEKRS